MAMPERPSESAERVHLQWNGGWETWQEVMPQYAGEPGVVTFIRATTHQRTVEALREAEKALVKARSVIGGNITAFQSLEPDALGIGESEDYGQWAIRDEVVHHCNESTAAIAAALARIKEPHHG